MILRLSHRIGFMAPIAVAGILLIVGIFQVEQRISDDYRMKVERHRSADAQLSVLEAEFLRNRRAEKDFLLRRDEKYTAAHKEISARAEKTLAALDGLVDSPATRANLQAISEGYAAYQKNFATLATASIALGLDPSSGREGAMRAAVHSIEDLLKSVDDKDLRVSMLTMRRHEKDFIMRRDPKYVARHAEERAAFAEAPADKFGGSANQAAILAALDAYGKAFEDYAGIAKTEAAASESVSSAFAAVEPIFEQMSAGIAADKAAAEEESASTMQFVHRIAIAAILAAIATIAATVLLIGRSISRPIIATTKAMTLLAGGDTASDIPFAARRDEIGEMAGAVEVFRQAALANRRLEAEAAENRVRAEAERIRLQEEAEASAQARLRQTTSGLAAGLRRLADGDLDFQLAEPFAPDFEQLRHDLNSAVAQLGEALRAVALSSTSIDDGSREISESADDLSRRTEQQAASLEETAAALDEITVNVANSTKRAEEARSVAGEANRSAQKSGEIVSGAIEAMKRIENSSGQITNIIGVIDEIAFQTNLLALNAGVEAARAGEAGKGFAVVAQEVRELAQRSAQAAREIKDLIRNSSAEVVNGVRLVQDTSVSLEAIGMHVATINQHMDAITVSAREQSVGLSEVNTAVNQMDQVTQRNAAMVEETNAASASLASEAMRLREQISRFVLPNASAARDLRAVHGRMETAPPLTRRAVPAVRGNTALASEWTEF